MNHQILLPWGKTTLRLRASLAFFAFFLSMPLCVWGQEIVVCGEDYHKPYNPITTLSGDSSIIDGFGNRYSPAELVVPAAHTGSNPGLLPFIGCGCIDVGVDAGRFDLWFQDCEDGTSVLGSFTDPTPITPETLNGVTITQIGQQRRRRVCESFAYLNDLIVAPTVTCGITPQVVNVHIQRTAALSVEVAARATPYYRLINGQQEAVGIIDGFPWLVLNSGTAGGTSTSSPFLPPENTYHAFMQFTFMNNFYSGMASNIAMSQVDLQSVALHEAMHTLGFMSEMGANGLSRFSNSLVNGWSRWDSHLFKDNIAMLTQLNVYDWQYNANIGTFNSLLEMCNTANHLNFTTNQNTQIPVFTGNPGHLPGSSFSHICQAGATMNFAIALGDFRRTLSANELSILRTIGYNIPLPTGTVCNIGGNNDVGTCTTPYPTLQFCVGQTPPTQTITLQDLIGNDVNTTGVIGFEIWNAPNGSTLIGTSPTWTFTPANAGVYTLRYIPTNGTCQGNVTYLTIQVERCVGDCQFLAQNGGTIPANSTACNLICNGQIASPNMAILPLGEPNLDLPGWQRAIFSPDYVPNGALYTGIQMQGNNAIGGTLFAFHFGGGNFETGEAALQQLNLGEGRYFYSFYHSRPIILGTANNSSRQLSSYLLNQAALNQLLPPNPSLNTNATILANSQLIFSDPIDNAVGVPLNNTITANIREAVAFDVNANFVPVALSIGIDRNPNVIITTNQGTLRAIFDQIELVPDDFAIPPILSIGCGASATLGGHDFCMLSDVAVRYIWRETVTNTILLDYTVTHIANNPTPLIHNNLTGANVPTIPSIVVSPTNSTNYTLTRTVVDDDNIVGGFGFAQGTETATITINVLGGIHPIITATTTTICANNTAVLTASGGDFYAWSGGSTIATNTVSAGGIYTVTVSNSICSATATIEVLQNISCCAAPSTDYIVLEGDNVLSNPPVPLPATNQRWVINGTLTIDQDYTLSNAEIILGVGSRIIVANGNILTLQNAYLHGCGAGLWQAVVVEEGAGLNSSSSRFEDAEDAINLAYDTKSSIWYSAFYNNRVGIHIAASASGSEALGLSMGFNKFATYNNALLLPDERGRAGILCDALQNAPLIIGKPHYYTNLEYGIEAYNTSIEDNHSQYHQINSVGLLLDNATTLTPQYLDAKGGDYFTTHYDQCIVGISATNVSASVRYIKMTHCQDGIRLMGCVNQKILVTENELQTSGVGIDLFQNSPLSGGYILDNTLTLTGEQTGIGININEIQPYPNLSLYNNIINMQGGEIGVQVNGARVRVENNQIQLLNGATNLAGISIVNTTKNEIACNEIMGIGAATQHPNNTPAANSFFPTGILVGSSITPYLNCNRLDNLYNGIEYQGLCNATRMEGTTFDHHTNGLVLSPTAQIGAQGAANAGQFYGNRWLQTGTSAGGRSAWHQSNNPLDWGASRFFISATAAAPAGYTYLPPTNLTPAIGWFDVSIDNLPTYTCANNPCIPITGAGMVAGGTNENSTAITDIDAKTANGSLLFETFEEEFTYAAERELVAKLSQNPALLAETLYADFYVNKMNSLMGDYDQAAKQLATIDAQRTAYQLSIENHYAALSPLKGQIHYLDSLLSDTLLIDSLRATYLTQRDLLLEDYKIAQEGSKAAATAMQAAQYNTALLAKQDYAALPYTQQLEQNEKEVQAIYLSTIAKGVYQFTKEEADIVEAISMQCPYSGGKAVYQARSLYALIDPLRVYKDKEICFGEGIAWRKPSPQSYPLFQGGAGVVKVFPNPNNGQFVIDFEELVLTSLRIMDIMGKSVYHTKQANDRKISLSLPSGLYTLLVTDANGIEYHQKIVILQP